MEETIITQLIKAVLAGGPVAIIALLVGFIAYLLWEKKAMQKSNQESLQKLATTFAEKVKEERQDLINIIDRYQEGHINLLQAINEIKVLIATISGRL
jgi:uncharacterized protein YbgA (DUF1722 family)